MEEIFVPDATREPQAYAQTLLEILGDRDPMTVLSATPARLVDIVARTEGALLLMRPSDIEWSVAEIIGHLVDSEIAYSLRWRLMLTKEQPHYPAHDEKAFVALPKPPLTQVLTLFGALRAYDVWLLAHAPHEAWQRVGVHEEQGLETVERNVRKLAAHDLAHLNQIARALAAVCAGE